MTPKFIGYVSAEMASMQNKQWMEVQASERGGELEVILEKNSIYFMKDAGPLLMDALERLDRGEARGIIVPKLQELVTTRVNFYKVVKRAVAHEWALIVGDAVSETRQPRIRIDNSPTFKQWFACDVGGLPPYGTCQSTNLLFLSVQECLEGDFSVKARFSKIKSGAHESKHLMWLCLDCGSGAGITPLMMHPEKDLKKAKSQSKNCTVWGENCLPVSFG